MYQSTFWPGATDFKTEVELWCEWFKEKIDEIVFKIYQFESKID